jgi:hypothetical protein
VAELGEQFRGILCGGDALRRDRRVDRRRRRQCDPEPAWLAPDLVDERPLRRRSPPRVALLVAGHDVEQGGRVAHSPGKRTAGREALVPAVRRERHAAARGLDPEDAAARGRDANRAAAVRAVGGGREPGGDRDRRAAARPTRRARRVPGIPAHAVQLGLGHGGDPQLRRVGLADHDEARFLQAADDGDVEVRHVVGIGAGREGRADPGGLLQVFDR